MAGKLKNFVYAFIFHSRLIYLIAALGDKLFGRQVRILYGHNVRYEEMEAHGLFKEMGFMHVREFERKVRFMKEHCHPLTMDETVAAVSSGRIPARAVAVTFDDGYRDELTRLTPILEKYGVPAVMYLSSGFMDDRKPFWFNRIIECVSRTSKQSDIEKAKAIGSFARDMKMLTDEEKHQCIEELERQAGYRPSAHKRILPMLTWQDAKKMATSTMITIGAHTITHPILTKMSKAQAFHEITRGRDDIFEHMGLRAVHFAYPNGRKADYNRAIRDHIEHSGFVSAVATEPGGNGSGQDLFQLKRYGFDEEPLYLFALKILGFFDFINDFKALLLDRVLASVLVRRANPNDRNVYLTFDDGPHPVYTAPILEALKKSNVKATFFVSGSEVEKYPAIACRIVEEGHELANHSWHHEKWSHLNLGGLKKDVQRTERIIARSGGPAMPVYRPPYGRITVALLLMAFLRRMKIILWSIDSDDDRSDSVKTILAKCSDAEPGDIILFHDDNEAAGQALPLLIEAIRARGLEFACIRDMKWGER